MLLLLSIAALWHSVSSNAYFPNLGVGFHQSNDFVYKMGDEYKIEESKLRVKERHIKDAFDTISENTCVNFIDHNDAPGKKIDFSIENTVNEYGHDECMFLDDVLRLGNCLFTRYTIIHETMHVLGLAHTNNRPDWSKYLRILPDMDKWVNKPEMKATPVVAYDYGSGMHHNLDKTVIVPVDEAYARTMGQSVRFSFSDYYSINWLYNCSRNCATQPDCKNGGYTHPRDCTKCMCNKYYIGDLCETPRNLIELSCEDGKKEHKWSINHTYNETLRRKYVLVDDFLNHGDDRWDIIQGPEDKQIEVEILSNLHVYYKFESSPACISFASEVNDGDFNLVGRMFCNLPESPSEKFVARSNKLGFHSEWYDQDKFIIEAKFTLLGCDE